MELFYPEYDVLRAVLIFDLAKTKEFGQTCLYLSWHWVLTYIG